MLRFFAEDTTQRAIESLATASRLTVVVGAGASMEVGLPSWEELVEGLLRRALKRKGWEEDEKYFLRRSQRFGLLTSAEIVTSLLRTEDLSEAVYEILYKDDAPRDFYPGPLARGHLEHRLDEAVHHGRHPEDPHPA